MKILLLILPVLLGASAPSRAADTLRVSLARNGSFDLNRPGVIQFTDYVVGRMDAVQFVPNGGRPVAMTQKMLADLATEHGLKLTWRDGTLVELGKKLALPAQVVVKTGAPVSAGANQGNRVSTPGNTPPEPVKLTGFYFDDAVRLITFKQGADSLKKILALPPYNLKPDSSNRYLDAFLAENSTLNLQSAGPAAEGAAEAQGVSGLLNPTTAIDALGTFIANRFRQELTIAYLDRFRTWLDVSLVNERVLFPASYLVMARSDPFEYTTFLPTLREAFGADLQTLPPHTIAYLDANRHLLTNPEVRLGLKATLHVVDQVRLSAPPLAVARQLDAQPWLTGEPTDSDLAKGLRLFASLARGASRAQSKTALALLSEDDLTRLLNEKLLRNGFLGLLLLGEKTALSTVSIANQTVYARLTAPPTANDNPAAELFPYFKLLNQKFQAVKALRDGFETDDNLRANQPREFQEVYFQYLEAIRDLVESGVMQAPLKLIPGSQKPKLEAYFLSSKQLLQVAKHVAQKQYGLALTTTLAVIEPHLDSRTVRRFEVYRQVAESMNAQKQLGITFSPTTRPDDILSAINAKIGTDSTLGKLRDQLVAEAEKVAQKRPDWLTSLTRYGNFMVTVVNTKTGEELAAALDAAALPVGSYRIKRNSRFSLALNAYGGLYGGKSFGSTYQAVSGTGQPLATESFIFGPSAPIGITFGRGSGRGVNRKDGRFWGVSVPLLDVGGVFAFRLLDKKTELPELSWRNVFTPGLYLVHSPKWLPALALSAGVQYGPELRGVKLNTTAPDNGQTKPAQAEFNVRGWRVGGTVTVDIPLFNLYTRYE